MNKQIVGVASEEHPYVKAVKIGNLVFISGRSSFDLKTGKMVKGDIRVQTRQTLENLKLTLEEAGLTLEAVIKVTVFLKDMNDYREMNKVYYNYFKRSPAARTCVRADLADKDLLIEVDAIAYSVSVPPK